MGKDYYKILEVDRNADEAALKKSKLQAPFPVRVHSESETCEEPEKSGHK